MPAGETLTLRTFEVYYSYILTQLYGVLLCYNRYHTNAIISLQN